MKKWSNDMVSAFESCQESQIIDLLNHGFPPEIPLIIRDKSNDEILERTHCAHLACEYNFLHVLQELIKLGCNIEALDSKHRTPLMVACEVGNLEIVQFLTLNCKVSIKGFDYAGNTVLHIAALNGQIAVLKFLVDSLGIHIKILNSQKKTALALCRDIYALKFDPVIEKTLSYLIYKNSSNEVGLYQPNHVESVHLNNFNCHEMCKEKYFHEHGNGLLRVKLKSMADFKFIKDKKTNAFQSKRKFKSLMGNSFEEVASVKSDLVFRKVLQDEIFLGIDKVKSQLINSSSPVLRLKQIKFNGSMSGGSRKPRSSVIRHEA